MSLWTILLTVKNPTYLRQPEKQLKKLVSISPLLLKKNFLQQSYINPFYNNQFFIFNT